jgi:hypothetical protein
MDKSRQVTLGSFYDTINLMSPFGIESILDHNVVSVHHLEPEAHLDLVSILLSSASAEIKFISCKLAETLYHTQDEKSLFAFLNSSNDLISFLALLILQNRPRGMLSIVTVRLVSHLAEQLYEILKPVGFKRILAAIEAMDKASQPFALAFFAGFPPGKFLCLLYFFSPSLTASLRASGIPEGRRSAARGVLAAHGGHTDRPDTHPALPARIFGN